MIPMIYQRRPPFPLLYWKHPRKTRSRRKKGKKVKRKLMFGPLCAVLLLALLLPGRAYAAGEEYYPACPASEASLVDALKGAGAEASYSARMAVAEANGIDRYQGTAEQNLRLLGLMKQGKLRRPENRAGAGPLADNLSQSKYIRQDKKTCKASSVAMALNLLTGSDTYTTKGLGSAQCKSIDGKEYRGSDGILYTGIYKTDRYAGSLTKLTEAIDAALSAGLPIVAAVHSTRSGGTRHHWVLIIGRSGADYLMADPAWGIAGSIAENSATLSSRSYALGLTDYDTPHYGYVTFRGP